MEAALKTVTTDESEIIVIDFMDVNAVLKGQVSFTRPLPKNEAFEQCLFIMKADEDLKPLLDKQVASIFYPKEDNGVIVVNLEV